MLTWKVWLVKDVDLGKSFCLKLCPFECKLSFETTRECKIELYDVMLVSCWGDDNDDDADEDIMVTIIYTKELRWMSRDN